MTLKETKNKFNEIKSVAILIQMLNIALLMTKLSFEQIGKSVNVQYKIIILKFYISFSTNTE